MNPSRPVSDRFSPINISIHPATTAAQEYVDRCDIGGHPFFALARTRRDALELWVGQECCITNPVAQEMLRVASDIENVHLRSLMTAVAWGEHSIPKSGIAKRAHPWLLNQLRSSMGVPMETVYPLEETNQFLRSLEAERGDTLRMVAAIGVGNESLIIPEYSMVKECFAQACPECNYEEFLDANINEDVRHTRMLAELASALIAAGGDPREYLEAARASVDARVRYYDCLYDRVKGSAGAKVQADQDLCSSRLLHTRLPPVGTQLEIM